MISEAAPDQIPVEAVTLRLLAPSLRYAFALALSVLLAWLVFRKLNVAVLGQTLRHANPAYIAPIVAVLLLRYWLRAVRWQGLVRHIRDIPMRQSSDRVVLAQAIDQVMPFQLGCVLTIHLTAAIFRIQRLQLFGTDLMERMTDGLVFALFMTVALATLSIGAAFTGLAAFMLFGTLTGFTLAWIATRRPDGRILPAHWPGAEALHRFLFGLRAIQDWRRSLAVFATALAIWGAEALLYWLAGLALGIPASPLVYVFLVAASNIGASIPLAHSSVGFVFVVQQALAAFGHSKGLSTAYALSLEALISVPLLVLGPLAARDLGLTLRDLFPPWSRPVPDERPVPID